MNLELPDWRQQFWNDNPNWERERIEAMLSHIHQGDKVIDVGAELGDITALLAKAVGNTGEVVAIEAVARTWAVIKNIFGLNQLPPPTSIVAFAGAATRNDPVVHTRKFPPEADGEIMQEPGFQHLDERWDLPVVAIDDLNYKPDMITMDVEGSELEVLIGARYTLAEHKPKLFISVHPQFMRERYKQTPEELHKFLESLGYTGKLLATDHEEHWYFT